MHKKWLNSLDDKIKRSGYGGLRLVCFVVLFFFVVVPIVAFVINSKPTKTYDECTSEYVSLNGSEACRGKTEGAEDEKQQYYEGLAH